MLTLHGNDPNTPTASVPLEGWVQYHSENSNEPSLQSIVNLLYGWSTQIAPTVPTSELTESSSTSNSSPTYYGQEVVSNFWQEADTSLAVNVQQLAGYHTEGNVATTYWYTQGSSSYNKLFETAADDGQTIFPLAYNSSSIAAASFSSTGTFGFRVDSEYSNDAQNTASATGGGHHFRFYPVISANGTLVPNTYIMAMDYSNTTGSPQNYDFQDNVWIVTNIKPATVATGITAPQSTGGGPPTPTDLFATNVAAGENLLQWGTVSTSSIAGYNVYRATSATGPYTLLTSSPISTLSFSDTTAPHHRQFLLRSDGAG